jgi:hypothetical protein
VVIVCLSEMLAAATDGMPSTCDSDCVGALQRFVQQRHLLVPRWRSAALQTHAIDTRWFLHGPDRSQL